MNFLEFKKDEKKKVFEYEVFLGISCDTILDSMLRKIL